MNNLQKKQQENKPYMYFIKIKCKIISDSSNNKIVNCMRNAFVLEIKSTFRVCIASIYAKSTPIHVKDQADYTL